MRILIALSFGLAGLGLAACTNPFAPAANATPPAPANVAAAVPASAAAQPASATVAQPVSATNTAESSSVAQPMHRWVVNQNGQFGYTTALTDADRAAGHTAAEVVMFRYLGLQQGLDTLESYDSGEHIRAQCARPCAAIRLTNGAGEVRSFPYDPSTVIGAAISDAQSGQLGVSDVPPPPVPVVHHVVAPRIRPYPTPQYVPPQYVPPQYQPRPPYIPPRFQRPFRRRGVYMSPDGGYIDPHAAG
jgi:hypothetical protein